MAIAGAEPVVTVLFTDIESSTSRWEDHPEAMAADLARHDEIVRAAVAQSGGEVFGHTGDGMCAAFGDPWAAVTAAVAAQGGLAGAPWAAPVPLRVRMGVHSGPVQRRAGNYFGPTLNRAARLMAVGSGGQVLCSGATVDLLGGRLPAEVSLVDLGDHRLKDLGRPERVFQVAHPRLAAQFPPLRSLGNHRHNLPVALNSFVGRQSEQKELAEMLREHRLVSVTGVGGAGKTRLALQVAAGVIEHHPDGVWLVELAALRDGSLVASALSSALGLETGGLADAEAVVDHVITYLEHKRALLLFDNCEHLVDASARLIHDLLARCSDVIVLATSREVLGLPGEVAWRVPPLSLPPAGGDPAALVDCDAAVLFWERVTAARPGLELSAANAVDVARICRRLDGIPLALELAAARVPLLGVHEVAERMDDCFSLLTGGARTALPRQQTLRATLDWSYGLLTTGEQAALRALAVFPAGFLLDAAEAVVEGDVFGLVAALVDKSLVTVADEGDGPVRYRLLGPVRQYARERLVEAGDEVAALRRHRDFFVGLMARWGYHRFPEVRMDRVTADQESFAAALEWSWGEGDFEAALHLAVAMWLLFYMGGRPGGRVWLERVVAKTPDLEHPARSEAGMALAFLSGDDPARRAALWQETQALAHRLDDRYALAMLASVEAEMALGAAEPDRARTLCEHGLALYEELGYDTGTGFCHHHLGWIALAGNDRPRARRHFEQAVEASLTAGAGKHSIASPALGPLAVLCVRDGEVEGGLRLADEAVAAARSAPIPLFLVMALTHAAETAIVADVAERAADSLAEALLLLTKLATLRYLGDCLDLVALTHDARGQRSAAARMLGAAAAVRRAMGETPTVRLLADELEACRARLTGALGEDAFARFEAEGLALPPERALTLALADLGRAGTPPHRL